jgi:hypothetical protein
MPFPALLQPQSNRSADCYYQLHWIGYHHLVSILLLNPLFRCSLLNDINKKVARSVFLRTEPRWTTQRWKIVLTARTAG